MPRIPALLLALGLSLPLLAILALVATTEQLREARPEGIMGTSCHLVAVAGGEPLAAAEARLRAAEAVFSTWIEASPTSRFNATPVGTFHHLHPDLATVLDLARSLHRDSRGTFDATCGPLVRLWRQAGKTGRLPTATERAEARAASNWSAIELDDAGRARRTSPTARLDLGGIAKGWAIDRAVEAMQASGASSGLVDVGGDLRVFGPGPGGAPHWRVDLRSPWDEDGIYLVLAIRDQAVCTSGNYARGVAIDGVRYSHIVDPRSGEPASLVASVTVVGPETAIADAWATALSVLGPDGLARLPTGYDALLLTGFGAEAPKPVTTAGFGQWIID